MDMARWAATAALAFQVALRWLRLALDVSSSGRPLRLVNFQTEIVSFGTPCVKSLGSVQRSVDVAPGSDDSSGSAAPQKAQPSSIQGFWTKQDTVSYSTLLRDIDAKAIKQLDLVPGRREVRVQYNDGRRVTVPVFANDNQILRVAESSGTPLTVVDIRREQAGRELAGTLMLVLLVVVGLSLLLKRSAQLANRALGFGRSQPRLKPQEDLQLRFEDVAGINDARLELEEVVTFSSSPRPSSAWAPRSRGECCWLAPWNRENASCQGDCRRGGRAVLLHRGL